MQVSGFLRAGYFIFRVLKKNPIQPAAVVLDNEDSKVCHTQGRLGLVTYQVLKINTVRPTTNL